MNQNFDSETNVLAGMLKSERSLYEGLTVLTAEHFTDPDWIVVFETMQRIAESNVPTFGLVYKELRTSVDVNKLRHLNQFTVSEGAFPVWLNHVHENYVRRSYYEAATEIQEICMTGRPLSEIAELVERRILKAAVREGTETIITPKEAGSSALATFEKRLASKEKVHGIKLSRELSINGRPTTDGFPGIDRALMGLKGGDMIIIGAQTGEGKTTLAQNIVRHASIHQGYRTFYQNTEMDPEEMVFRFAAQLSSKNFGDIYSGDMDEFEAGSVRKAIEDFSGSNVYTSELPLLTPERSRGLARQFKMQYGQLDLLVIDYVGRMELDSAKGKQEWQVLKEIAKQSKRLGQEIDACVILIAQLNEEGKIQGAKAMANEADAVFFLEAMTSDEKDKLHAPAGASHRLIPYKVRRGSKADKIWIGFNKPKMYITEVLG